LFPYFGGKIKYESFSIRSKKKNIGRGTINGYIQQLKKKSLLNLSVNPDNKKEKSIEISYLGIAYFLNELYKRHFK